MGSGASESGFCVLGDSEEQSPLGTLEQMLSKTPRGAPVFSDSKAP